MYFCVSPTFVVVRPPPPLSLRKHEVKQQKEPKKPVIKKPLNAFMLYMKEMRAKVIAECTLKESAAINQILGRRVRDHAYTHARVHKLSFSGLLNGAEPSSSQFESDFRVWNSCLLAVARADPGGTGQVLRVGPERETAPHAALPDLVRPR